MKPLYFFHYNLTENIYICFIYIIYKTYIILRGLIIRPYCFFFTPVAPVARLYLVWYLNLTFNLRFSVPDIYVMYKLYFLKIWLKKPFFKSWVVFYSKWHESGKSCYARGFWSFTPVALFFDYFALCTFFFTKICDHITFIINKKNISCHCPVQLKSRFFSLLTGSILWNSRLYEFLYETSWWYHICIVFSTELHDGIINLLL